MPKSNAKKQNNIKNVQQLCNDLHRKLSMQDGIDSYSAISSQHDQILGEPHHNPNFQQQNRMQH